MQAEQKHILRHALGLNRSPRGERRGVVSSVREWGDCEHGIRIHKCPECALSELTTLRARIAELEREKGELRAEKHGVYAERNLLVAALSKIFPSHMERTTIEGWDPEWEQCVYITLPTGQVSWHLKAGEEMNFQHLAWSVVPRWDGHDTLEKYRRLAALKPTTLVPMVAE